MQELTFETILRLPQMELKKRLKAELKSRGYPVTDKPGYLYAEGTIPVLLVAHMDTVHRQPVEQICYSADRAVAMSPQGIGGDDRCGVWMILQILRTANCHVLFCEDEEVGCVGAKKFTRGPLRPQVNYIVELDRRGSNDAVFYRCDNPEFEDFVTSFGFETAGGSCSDISYIAPYAAFYADPDNSRQIIQLGPVSNSMASTLYSYAVNEMKVSYRSWYI